MVNNSGPSSPTSIGLLFVQLKLEDRYNRNNYDIWKIRMKYIYKDLWGIVDVSFPRHATVNNHTQLYKKDAKKQELIC
jgi:hypothetical protein